MQRKFQTRGYDKSKDRLFAAPRAKALPYVSGTALIAALWKSFTAVRLRANIQIQGSFQRANDCGHRCSAELLTGRLVRQPVQP